MNGLVYISGVATLKLDEQKCSGCTMCTIVCPHDVFAMKDKKATIQNLDFCMECGACQKNCPEGAISVQSGVGCAAAVINGLLKGTAPNCDCSNTKGDCC